MFKLQLDRLNICRQGIDHAAYEHLVLVKWTVPRKIDAGIEALFDDVVTLCISDEDYDAEVSFFVVLNV